MCGDDGRCLERVRNSSSHTSETEERSGCRSIEQGAIVAKTTSRARQAYCGVGVSTRGVKTDRSRPREAEEATPVTYHADAYPMKAVRGLIQSPHFGRNESVEI